MELSYTNKTATDNKSYHPNHLTLAWLVRVPLWIGGSTLCQGEVSCPWAIKQALLSVRIENKKGVRRLTSYPCHSLCESSSEGRTIRNRQFPSVSHFMSSHLSFLWITSIEGIKKQVEHKGKHQQTNTMDKIPFVCFVFLVFLIHKIMHGWTQEKEGGKSLWGKNPRSTPGVPNK